MNANESGLSISSLPWNDPLKPFLVRMLKVSAVSAAMLAGAFGFAWIITDPFKAMGLALFVAALTMAQGVFHARRAGLVRAITALAILAGALSLTLAGAWAAVHVAAPEV